MNISASLLEKARIEAVAVDLPELIQSDFLAADAVISDQAPQWLHEELAEYRLRLYRDPRGQWFVGPFDE
jgi:hypothetical protein